MEPRRDKVESRVFRPGITFALCLLLVSAVSAAAQSGAVRGVVMTAAEGEPVSGVAIRVAPDGRRGRARRAVTDADGQFVLADLSAGAYLVRATHRRFSTVTERVVLTAGQTTRVEIRLTLLPIREELNVQAAGPGRADEVPALTVVPARLADVAPLQGDDFAALLPVLPGVIRQPDGRLSLAGGRPEQSGLQVNESTVTDPVTGSIGIELPLDAVESVSRFNSPFAAEYGRFSSGVVRIETRRSDNDWRFSATNFMPSPRVRDGRIRGLSSFSPRLLVGGAIVRDRLFLTQSLQYEMRTTRVHSLPDGEDLQELERVSSFTRLDASLSDRHDLTATVALFPRDREHVNLATFRPEPATPNVRERGFQVDLSERAVVQADFLVTSTFSIRQYDVDVLPQGEGAMSITTAGRSGTFFHHQERKSRSYQWIETVTRSFEGRSGTHLLKAGFDLLRSGYSGAVDNGTVEIRRADGTLAERITFPGSVSVQASGTDVAVFVQDRWRARDRALVDVGVRMDRDGVLGHISMSPRAGAAFALLDGGRGIVRGGVGWFAHRTPLAVAAFEQQEQRIVSRFAADGVTPDGPARAYDHVQAAGEVPGALVWSVGYDHRLTDRLVARVAYLQRRSRDEFVVEPVGSTLLLRSDGRSDYKETEVTLAYSDPQGAEAVVSYVSARADGDFNHFDRFFGDDPAPIIQESRRGPFDFDVPRRLVMRGTWPRGAWRLGTVIEIRSGFPYSALDERQRFVGTPNGAGRLPAVATVDVSVGRVLTLKGRRVLVGLRAYNLFNRFTPRDVQQNLASAAFGAFYNGIERRVGVTLQLNPPDDGRR